MRLIDVQRPLNYTDPAVSAMLVNTADSPRLDSLDGGREQTAWTFRPATVCWQVGASVNGVAEVFPSEAVSTGSST